MRTAFVSTIIDYPLGGADALWHPAAQAAVARGDQVLLAVNALVAAHPTVQAMTQAGAELFIRKIEAPTKVTRLKRKLSRTLRWDDPLIVALEAFRPDRVVVSCGGTYDVIYDPELCDWLRRARVPYYLIANFQKAHAHLPETDRQRAGALLSGAAKSFFVSRANIEITRAHLLLPLPQARVAQYPIRLPAARAGLPWPDETVFSFAAVARLEPVKGLDLLIQAIAAELATEPNWRCDIFGRGPDDVYLQALIVHHGLGERVRLRGFVQDLDNLWADQHLLLSPALDEGVPMTIPEAMFRGRPVLATCVGGAADWIADGETGYLCAYATVPLLRASLRRAWNDRAHWRALGQRAHAAAHARYNGGEDYREVIA